jgi:hypothetical protein
MSIKTLRKRIALVAVSALGAGLMSVVVVPAASAGAVASETMEILDNINQAAATLTDADEASAAVDANASVGLLAESGSGVTMTATMLSTGSLAVVTGATSSVINSIVVSGGTITKALHTTSNTTAFATTTYAVAATVGGTEDDNAPLGVIVRPNSGVATMTIQFYQGSGITESLPTNGTLKAQATVTVASASEAGTFSTVFSRVNTAAVTSAPTYTGSGAFSATVDGVDQTGASVVANGGLGAINITLKDAYGTLLSGKGALVVNGTGGAGLAYSGTLGTGTTPTLLAVADSSDSEGTISVARPSALANKSFTTTITITWNGVTVATKTFRFEGEVAKVVAASPTIQRTGATTSAAPWAFRVTYFDDKDNALYPQSGTSVVSTTLNTAITAASINTYGVAATATSAKGQVTCNTAVSAGASAGAGTASLQLQHINSSGSIIKSNVWTQKCAGDADTYTVALDAAVYTPGSVATLTVTCKDAKGNLANAVDPISSTGSLLSVTGLGTSVTAPANGDACGDDGEGIKKYQFVVGNTEGTYTAVISSPVINAQSESVTGANQSIAYKIAASTATVSTNEVLAAIVKLIATINKQIRQLQKQLRR